MTTAPVQRHNYFSASLIGEGTDSALARISQEMQRVEFDTFVVRGMSGAIAGGLMAHHLKKNLYVIRKPDDDTHDGALGFGVMGRRWVFLDDFISSGNTYSIVRRDVATLYNDGVWDTRSWMPRAERWKTNKAPRLVHVGAYLYRDEQFFTATNAIAKCYRQYR